MTTLMFSSSLRIQYIGLGQLPPQRQSFDSLLTHRIRKCVSPSSARRSVLVAATKGSAKSTESDDKIPSWAKPDSDEVPPWARGEAQGESPTAIPFYVYLLSSAITAIAAIGSIFEYVNQRPVFGVLNSDSVLYGPLLGFFVFTGIPTSAFLWFKSVQVANKEAEEQDRRDGY